MTISKKQKVSWATAVVTLCTLGLFLLEFPGKIKGWAGIFNSSDPIILNMKINGKSLPGLEIRNTDTGLFNSISTSRYGDVRLDDCYRNQRTKIEIYSENKESMIAESIVDYRNGKTYCKIEILSSYGVASYAGER